MRISWPHILIVLLIVLLLFGASRLPDIARNVGRSMRVMKDEIKDLREDAPAASGAAGPAQPSGQAPASYQPPTGQVPTGYEQTSTPQAPPPTPPAPDQRSGT